VGIEFTVGRVDAGGGLMRPFAQNTIPAASTTGWMKMFPITRIRPICDAVDAGGFRLYSHDRVSSRLHLHYPELFWPNHNGDPKGRRYF